MDLDRYKRRVGTRIIGLLDMVIGSGVFIYQLHRMWSYYLKQVQPLETNSIFYEASTLLRETNSNNNDNDEVGLTNSYNNYFENQSLEEMELLTLTSTTEIPAPPLISIPFEKLPFPTFLLICFVTFGINVFQICLGFFLVVSTFGRNQAASIRIASFWSKGTLFLLFILVLKIFILGIGFITNEIDKEWTELCLSVFEIGFHSIGIVWVTKFVVFLLWQAEFDRSCPISPRF